MGFHEFDLFSKYKSPKVYFRYVNDTFCAFGSETEAGEFFSDLNNMHPALRFTLEKENNSTLPFLVVLVCKETSTFLTIVYRKSTFTGLYIRWDSFCPKKRKINLIKTLTHRTLMICFESKLDDKVKFITGTLCNNGFPEDIVQSVIRDKISDFSKIKPDSVQKFPPTNIVVLWFILLDVFAVCNTTGEPINIWIQELNIMYPQKYGRRTT